MRRTKEGPTRAYIKLDRWKKGGSVKRAYLFSELVVVDREVIIQDRQLIVLPAVLVPQELRQKWLDM